MAAENRYAHLQTEWDQALRDLKSAVEEFSAILEHPKEAAVVQVGFDRQRVNAK